jgi:hypothetical protein
MAYSYKKAILKEKPRNFKISTIYWRRIRRNWKTTLQTYRPFRTKSIAEGYFELIFESQKSIFNDYDYCDGIFYLEFGNSFYPLSKQEEYLKKHRRK